MKYIVHNTIKGVQLWAYGCEDDFLLRNHDHFQFSLKIVKLKDNLASTKSSTLSVTYINFNSGLHFY